MIHICSFEAINYPRPLTYEGLKFAAIQAGRFSVFEATASRRKAKWFTKLCRDPDIITYDLGFPWTGIRLARTLTHSEWKNLKKTGRP